MSRRARSVVAVAAAVLVAGLGLAAHRRFAAPPTPLSDLLRPPARESLAGLEMGLQPADREILVTEAPSIDFIRAEAASRDRAVPDVEPPPFGTFLIADFDKDGVTEREWACEIGSWISDPTDPTIRCLEAYDPVNRVGEKGYGLKLWYDLDSPNPAYGGLWIKFEHGDERGIDAREYRNLVMVLKGSSTEAGFTTRVSLELKSRNQVGKFLLTGIEPRWKRFLIPLSSFRGLTDRASLTELAVVIDDKNADDREGILYFDEVAFTR